MSVQSFTQCLHHSQAEGATRMVMWDLAWHANQATEQAWPSRATIMAETGLSERSVTAALTELQRIGEIKLVGYVGRIRCWQIRVGCPDECDGSSEHVMGAARTERARARREASAARKQRAARGTGQASVDRSPEEVRERVGQTFEADVETVEAAEDGPGGAQNLRPYGVEGSAGGAKSAPLGAQNLRGKAVPSLIGERQGKDTTTKDEPGSMPSGSTTAGSGEPVVAGRGRPAGGGVLVDQVRAVLPSELRRTITTAALGRYLRGPLDRGLEPSAVVAAIQGRDWTGAHAGALITFLRELGPDDVTAPQSAGPDQSWCEAHPDVETTHRRCPQCATAARERGKRAHRRDGESREQWMARLREEPVATTEGAGL